VVLSSSVEADGSLDDYAKERIQSAADIALRYPAAHLFSTRVGIPGTRVTSDSAQRSALNERRVPLSQWTVMSGPVTSTRDEALLTRSYVSAGIDTIIVVTSVSHTRRACAAFERVGYAVVCTAARMGKRRWWRHAYDFVYERAATVEYRINGWIK
jgi:uncharacterized SAM-binding protein YcdF (DUF218 family)